MLPLTFEDWDGHDRIQEAFVKCLPVCPICKARIFETYCDSCKKGGLEDGKKSNYDCNRRI